MCKLIQVLLFTTKPMPLARRSEPFSHPEWLFKIKHDG
jgi:hypothetical protein